MELILLQKVVNLGALGDKSTATTAKVAAAS